MESITTHSGDLAGRQIINQAQVVLTVWANVDVSAKPVLKKARAQNTARNLDPIRAAAYGHPFLGSPA
jgi:hypothetical protein